MSTLPPQPWRGVSGKGGGGRSLLELGSRALPCLRARAPVHRVPGRPVLTAHPCLSLCLSLRASACALPCLPGFHVSFPGIRWVSRSPSLACLPSGGPRRRDERRLLELRERRAGGGARLQLPAAGGRGGCRLLLWLPRPQILLRRPAQLLPLRAQLHVVAQVQALILISP